ncbi:ubiquitin-conjugating enzyme [Poronia punctata]|nr:ubiquitin-conjugating enzyme [Poronia punctata]
MASQKRIAKELQLCMSDPIDGLTITLPSEADLGHWTVYLGGPAKTPYEGGTFELSVTFPPEYPFKAFAINFVTRIYHPNVTNDSTGNVCIAALKPDEYKPNKHVRAVLEEVRDLLIQPNPNDPLEARIADEYNTDRAEFEKNAKAYMMRFARGAVNARLSAASSSK